MSMFRLALILGLLAVSPTWAADQAATDEADLASKTAQVELLRARAMVVSSASVNASLLEADDLLRQLRQAPPAKRALLRAQLDAALTRLDLEIDGASRGR
ncbi:hypothetical protein [Magnetospirillum aberrantis]|uniref:YbgF trimerisation domain-containing protein n=1 Tax=Magnetospirillum aberrantis SpK TaxID=908842 RepID=A0A7C9QRR0_9PROT|nr:hypothetical protein [Magnetospirillum aberrantis]NFV78824.1 hypothetical protein [Magnetospirillum aberrantis SpK]